MDQTEKTAKKDQTTLTNDTTSPTRIITPTPQSQADGHADTKDETKAPQPVGSER